METVADLEILKDRYEIVTQVGQGGMSIVYKARDKTLDRLVALKTLSVKSLSEKQLVQFQAEARALSNLKHKNIMEILDFGITKTGKPYMVLEYIEGISLSKYIENVGPLPLILCLSIFSELCEALNHAHNKGVLHRDIKPSNIILVSNGKDGYTPKIIDFGIAVLGFSQYGTDSSMQATGSPPYMSPEQIEGGELDQRSDIYSLGCTLFEALTGKVPYLGATAFETMNLHKTATLPPLGKVCEDPNINYALQNCVHKSLAKNKNERFQYVIAFQKVMDEIKAHALESAKIKKTDLNPEQTNTSSKKKLPLVWIFSGLLSFLLLGLSYFAVSSEYSKKAKRDEKIQSSAQKLSDERSKESNLNFHEIVHHNDDAKTITQKFLDQIPDDSNEICLRNATMENGDFSTLARIKNLDKLILSASNLNPEQVEQISHLTSLSKIFMPANEKIADADFSSFSRLKNLKHLNVEGCNLTKKALLPISKLKTLKELNVRMETGFDQEIIHNLQKMPLLTRLEIGGNSTMDIESKKVIGNFPHVNILGLDALLLDDDTTELISKNLNGVEKLNFTHNLITLSGLEALLKIPSLKWININGCDQVLSEEAEDELSILSKKYKNVKIVDKSRFVRKTDDDFE